MTAPVFLSTFAQPGAVGDLLGFGPEVAGHAVRVRKLGPGAEVDIIDGAGLRLSGVIETASPEALSLRVRTCVQEPAPRPALVLVQALAKGDRDLAGIEAACEVGVDEVVPWAAQRSIVDWPAKKAAKSHAKWLNTLRAATLQARRSRVPVLHDLVRGTSLAGKLGPGDACIVLHETAQEHLPRVLAQLPEDLERIVFVVGPEGGISDAELAALQAAGARPALLGTTILRASTAGPVALGIAQVALGRWA
ncbi:16S rRNA (uracil(1498)-N(3))-methyltransferase [Brevibacterium sp. 50QC2O2]|uniref:16S rRNA (uracil(1498)-N(3))-methyltransferase n=1 Tax=Brevibacterium TaxID=1696 RepID=UPI00211BDA3C|nr:MULTISPECIES: 16S rRNA (uracil(1498)-N(3))-methyltransferase [unclassified Brevibacterium]MCQ9366929.1 16S rRNA (uracil(1498)-N(3))-methyltransferase [Brevibacterium sp. 91QC2O2]MCQ9384079.1 16S rRNA (uracil(1498)-N(3))-methyltransferase [Brevibacterium sp. 68QC2CO]MCQ9388443.1 16S rRNA (uracil(1498)-N(3))-methyltransferase [Brevibacterium sp. 50QC2O2]